jgi:type I restriction enzyme M protein
MDPGRAGCGDPGEARAEGEGIVSGAKAIVDKLWNYCNILRDDGLSYGDYLEQLTYLLFLKMAEEQRQFGLDRIVPEGYDWPSLLDKKGEALEAHYIAILNHLGGTEDLLGVVFRKAQNRIQDPAKLERLIRDLIGSEQWMDLDADVKGDAYEGLLEKNAADTKSGAGQYFTPRALIGAMVDVMRPGPDMRICDPACGTGGFFLAAFDHILGHHTLDPDQKRHARSGLFTGWEIVDNTARLCAMNLLLHGIESPESDSPIHVDDALRADPGERLDMVLTNPPFGKKSSVTIVNGEGRAEKQSLTVVRDDFWASTSNKQLNFVQHVKTLLKVEGSAAVVVPDNVLFEGGAGETIRRRLLHECDVHTLLRLPTGIFYAQGVKANVLFFDRKPGSDTPWTKDLWIYDLRTNQHFTLKTKPLSRADLDDFVACYRAGQRDRRTESERFRRFSYDELVARDKASLDIFWLRDESLEDTDSLPPPGVIAAEIVEDLEAALAEFTELAESLQGIGVDIAPEE